MPLKRWQRFVDDVGIFLDRWAAYASALGWEPYDLFGCDRDRPFADRPSRAFVAAERRQANCADGEYRDD